MRNLLKLAFLPFVLVFLAGCNLALQEVTDASSYNKLIATTNDRMLLLNVVRASKGYPLYFTSIDAISANVMVQSEFGLDLPFGNAAPNSYKLTPKLTYKDNPTMSITPIASKERLSAIINPLELQTLQIVMDQGWDPSLIFHLAVRKVVWTTDDGKGKRTTMTVDNDPGDLSAFEKFACFSKALHDAEPTFRRNPGKKSFAVDNANLASIDKIVAVSEKGYTIADGRGMPIVAVTDADFNLTTERAFGPREMHACEVDSATNLAANGTPNIPNGVSTPQVYSLSAVGERPPPTDIQNNASKQQMILSLRSPHDMLKYLGEIVRCTQRKAPEAPVECAGENDVVIGMRGRQQGEPLISIDVLPPDPFFDYGALSVVFHGNTHAIPDENKRPNLALQAFAFISQVIAMRTSQSDILSPQTILTVQQ
ncbi:hypothetical protein [Parvibaculum sp.]|uniref:hypothetical protein n=1 Tax=Parvibaculum sp. TaxID=2024848 RepID=UPI001D3F8FCF|nr:hypothetical protein [Parvibaculum sp.]MBX3490431.1 hypothetical protein [Parvibaculum sp.]MCW5728289.1 hypothetical protein [Parvibaculum sp.]